MPSTELEYICTQSECFLEGWNAFDSVGIPLYSFECFLHGGNAFYRVGIALYRVGMLSTG
jgi:hypothetical protein